MKNFRRNRALALCLSCWMVILPLRGVAEDIDIYVGTKGTSSTGNPNVLIVLDNTSNWARQAQKWPEAEQQGQSEVAAIKAAINNLDASINVGLLEFVTSGNANNNGGFVRQSIVPMNTANKAILSTKLDTIYSGINTPDEKRNSNTPYGNLMADAYNYFAGASQSQGGLGTLAAIADSTGYTSNYSQFKSPISCATDCAKNFIIFIGNPISSGPANDDATNTAALSAAGGTTAQLGLPNFTTTNTPTSTTLGNSAACYASASACTSAGAAAYAGASFAADCADTSIYPNGCSCGTAVTTGATCAAGSQYYTVTGTKNAGTVTKTGSSANCYKDDLATPTTSTPNGWNNGANPETFSCGTGETLNFTAKVSPNTCGTNKAKYSLSCTQTVTTTTTLGMTSACYSSPTAAGCTSDYSGQAASYSSLVCGNPTATTANACTSGSKYTILGNSFTVTTTPTGTSTTDTNPFNADEWARHLYQNGVAVAGCDRQPVSTYTIDVYNAQQNAQHTSLLLSMAKVGGGKYYAAKNKSDIVADLTQIFREIQAVNSTFASASLPINATNRAQNDNQVFIGTFRPDPGTKPRWFGNIKQYKLINSNGSIVLGDANGNSAINYNTGFVTECAVSAWTTDSGSYWANYIINPSFADGQCTDATKFNDLPDGARVEKGSVAEVLRKGNNPVVTNDTPTWAVNRTLYTGSSTTDATATGSNNTTLAAFTTTSSGLSSTVVDWVSGKDTQDEDGDTNLTETRASIHGDVVHSRPLPVNYCTTSTNCSNVVAYYGANDGTLRAVNAITGQEMWAFVAPEFFSKIDRLRTQSPLVYYPSMPTPAPTPTPTRRDYYFDGSIGLYQTATNDNIWIFPTMRRGGSMVYAFDVTNTDVTHPTTQPVVKWKFGCDANGTCTTDASNIGQTWSYPNVAKLYNTTTKTSPDTTSTLSVVMGGGYDTCEDANTASPSCSTPKGNQVYVLNASDGTVIKSFATLRSVSSDVALIDMDQDGKADYAYVGDTGGNLYRIAFTAFDSATNSYAALASGDWTITRIAYTTGGGRKFQFSPALFGGKGYVYVALGSGDREHPLATDYPYTTPVTNRFYMYRDCIPDGKITASSLTGGDSLDDTAKMNSSSATATATCDSPQTLTSNCSTNKGWFINLNNGTGEQTVTSAVIASGMVTFSTNRAVVAANNVCSTELGEARGYWLNLFNGSGAIGVDGSCGGAASATFVGGGLAPSPVIGTVPIDGKPTTVVIGAVQKSGNPSVTIDAQKLPPVNLPARKKVYFQIKGDK